MPELLEKSLNKIIRSDFPGVGYQIPALIILKIQRAKEVDIKTLGKIDSISQGIETSNVGRTGACLEGEE